VYGWRGRELRLAPRWHRSRRWAAARRLLLTARGIVGRCP
jgi:hypothetical protein